MFLDGRKRKKFGIIMMLTGIACAVLMYAIRESNQPIYVSTSFGSGYMTDGWGDALPMFNFFIVLGVIEAIIGAVMTIWPVKE